MTDAPAITMAEIKTRLQARVRDLVPLLAPPCAGAWGKSGIYTPLNPARADKRPGSFVIWMSGTAAGSFRDYALGDDPAARGDILDLIAYVNGRPRDRSFARQWAMDWLGLTGSPAARRASTAQADKLAAERRQREQAENERMARDTVKNRDKALGWWLKADKDIAGTPVETYLAAARGIRLSALPHPPGALRYLADAVHRQTGELLPAMMAVATGPDGKAWAVHRTFLRPDGRGKADVNPAKMIWPRGWHGAAVRITKGRHRLPPEEAARRGLEDELMLTEGIEDALTLAMAEHDMRVWAALTLGNLTSIRVPACVARVFVAADNDYGKRQAQDALERGVAALRRQGRPVHVIRSPLGKDFNDLQRNWKGERDGTEERQGCTAADTSR